MSPENVFELQCLHTWFRVAKTQKGMLEKCEQSGCLFGLFNTEHPKRCKKARHATEEGFHLENALPVCVETVPRRLLQVDKASVAHRSRVAVDSCRR